MSIDVLCKGCPNLTKLRFKKPSTTPITDAAVQSIVRYCPLIEALSLNDWAMITDTSMTFLTQLPRLREIDLSYCNQLTSTGIQGLLKANRMLKSIKMSDFNHGEQTPGYIDGALMIAIGLYCPNLTKLDLSMATAPAVDVTAAPFEAMLKGLSALEELRISHYSKPNNILPALGMYCPRLKRLEINKIECSDDDFTSMCQGCPLIEFIDLQNNPNLTDISILSLATQCTMLKEVFITQADNITDHSLCTLFTSCTQLTSFTLINSPHITDKAILKLLKCCSKIRHIGLLCNPRLTDYCILAIATHCPLIQRLEIGLTPPLTHETIVQLSRYCKNIHTLFLAGSDLINNDTLLAILTNCKHLTNLNIQYCGLHMTDEFKAQCNTLTAKRRYRSMRISGRGESVYGS